MTLFDRPGITALAILLSCVSFARAELGGKVSEIGGAAPARLPIVRSVVHTPLYTAHASRTGAGVQVVEYATLSGTVFAVTWKGPLRPDLNQLLGPYFATYLDAAGSPGMGRRPLRLQRADLVIQSGGHMRDFSGRAWLPALLPAGVTPEDLR